MKGRALSQMPINMWKRVGIHSKRDWDWVLTLDFDPKPEPNSSVKYGCGTRGPILHAVRRERVLRGLPLGSRRRRPGPLSQNAKA